ncbi:SUKH-4 family immunity protein [Streptomyces sp. NRRL S-340]|uniref:SUKH-4 family immunity protein n=1 Tax=Streptomyces sp. NRRL S-340 TaxID=1463901 RepID=UPI000564AACB|nr:SUKH-4 family immunity protein [Streptomyces sp. NRRL S-340]
MVTFAQAQERAEEWINGDVPAYQHREVRVREFELGFVVWAEDRAEGPRSDGGRQRLVLARDSGEATLWPALPVGEVIRRYEEEYGRPEPAADADAAPPARVDLNQTSFLLSPPEWLQEAADRMGIPDRRSQGGGTAGGATGATGAGAGTASGAAGGAGATGAGFAGGPGAGAAGGSGAGPAPDGSLPLTQAGVPASGTGPAGGPAGPSTPGTPSTPGAPSTPSTPVGATPWAGTDTNADGGEDRSVPLPATVFAPPLSESDDGAPPATAPDAKTALMAGGSRLPRTAVAPALDGTAAPGTPAPAGAPGAPRGGTPAPPPGATPPPAPGSVPPPPGSTPAPGAPPPPPAGAPYGYPQAPGAQGGPAAASAGGAPGAPYPPAPGGPVGSGQPLPPHAGDIADAATSKAPPAPSRGRGAAPMPPPPGAPGTPGARPAPAAPPPAAPGAPGGAGGYVPTRLVSSLGPDGPEGPGAPQAPGTPPGPAAPGAPGTPGGTPPGGVHHAATMLADPGRAGGAPPPPGPPGAPGGTPGVPGPPQPPGAPGAPGAGQGGVHQAATMLAPPPSGGPGVPSPPVAGQPVPGQQPPAYGYPPQALPTVGPGYQAVLRYRAQDGSEQQLIRRSAPGTPHPEWQIFHELRAMNVPPDQVLELHTELESCQLPGAYCARMIREQWPQARITSIAPYGTDHASRQQGMAQLLAHQGELHQVADGPARPAPVRAPLPPVQPVPPLPPEGVAQELAAAFGPGVFRFEQAAVSRQGVPPVVAHTLVAAGLPLDMGPFFWAQAQPGRPVPTLAELAAERGVQPAPDAGSYLVMGSDFGKALCVQYGTANIVAVPVEAGPGGTSVPPQFVNTGLPEFARCLALLGRMWRLRYGLNQEQAGRWTVDFQAQLASLDPAALGSPESWWSVLLEQMWDGLL